jgi:hypothetical protein
MVPLYTKEKGQLESLPPPMITSQSGKKRIRGTTSDFPDPFSNNSIEYEKNETSILETSTILQFPCGDVIERLKNRIVSLLDDSS